MKTLCEYARQDHLNIIEYQVYKDLLEGKFIDHESPYSGFPSSLLYTQNLMGWYSLDSKFQSLLNKVFEGSIDASEFKHATALLLAEPIAAEILENQEND